MKVSSHNSLPYLESFAIPCGLFKSHPTNQGHVVPEPQPILCLSCPVKNCPSPTLDTDVKLSSIPSLLNLHWVFPVSLSPHFLFLSVFHLPHDQNPLSMFPKPNVRVELPAKFPVLWPEPNVGLYCAFPNRKQHLDKKVIVNTSLESSCLAPRKHKHTPERKL